MDKKDFLKGFIICLTSVTLCTGIFCGYIFRHEIKDAFTKGESKPVNPDKPITPIDPDKPLTYTMKFIVDEEETTKSVAAGGLIEPPTEPQKEGFTFKGWLLNGELVPDFSNLTATEDMTFIASFEEVQQEQDELLEFSVEGDSITGYNGTDTDLIIPCSYSLNSQGQAVKGDDIKINRIKAWTFQRNNNITSLEFESGISAIEEYAFYGCENLVSVKANEGLQNIGSYAFGDCQNLTNIELPASLTEFNKVSFQGSNNIEAITIAEGNQNLSSQEGCILSKDGSILLFGYKDIEIPQTVTQIKENAFANCNQLTKLDIPSSVTTIGSSAFEYCQNLKEITFPDNFAYGYPYEGYGECIFRGCTNLEKVVIKSHFNNIANLLNSYGSTPNKIINVYVQEEDFDFYLNELMYNDHISVNTLSNLETDIAAPKHTVKFAYMSQQNSLIQNGTIVEHGQYIDSSFSHIPSIGEIGENKIFSHWAKFNLLTHEVEEQIEDIYSYPITENTTFYAVFDTIAEDETNLLNCYFENGTLVKYLGNESEITLPSTYSLNEKGHAIAGNDIAITKIGNGAFNGYRNISKITLPDTITEIGTNAFSWCSNLTEITIPENVTFIGKNAFTNTGLEKIVILCNEVPTLESETEVFPMYRPIYVKDEVFNQWTAYTDQLHKISELNPPTETVEKLPFSFNGDALISYTGTDTNVVIPSTYSEGELEDISITFSDGTEIENWSGMNMIEYPCTFQTETGDEVTLNSFDEFYNHEAFFYYSSNITLTGKMKTFIKGNSNIVTEIGCRVFLNNQDLQAVIIEEGITRINEGAFEQCSNLTTVEIPSTLTIIDGNAFKDCTSLERVVIRSSQVIWSNDWNATVTITAPFTNCSELLEIYVQDALYDQYMQHPAWSALYGSKIHRLSELEEA